MNCVDKSVQTDPIQLDNTVRQEQGQENEEKEKTDTSYIQPETSLSPDPQPQAPFYWDINDVTYIDDYFTMDYIVPLGELEWPR